MSDARASLTVIEVAKAMGLELSANEAWAVGSAVRRIYEARHGELPPKALRPKTSGSGTHCFAVYPESWRGEIEGVIHSISPATSPQRSFF